MLYTERIIRIKYDCIEKFVSVKINVFTKMKNSKVTSKKYKKICLFT